MAGKQYEVLRPFRRTDRRTGAETFYEVGDLFPGPVDQPYYLDQRGPDGRGALLKEKPAPVAEKATPNAEKSAPTTDSSDKEK